MTDKPSELHLFDAFGIELEYMIVRQDSLDIAPAADELLAAAAGEVTGEYTARGMAWNNELVLHVIEFKTDGPQPQLQGLADRFYGEVKIANGLLQANGCLLLPGAMHPWMDPQSETRLWPHEASEIYGAFDRIFGCKGHGWSNLQSAHLNLPFCGDDEFRRLHSAIRVLLPFIPMLAAASPVVDAHTNNRLDNRLFAYRNNCARIPSVSGEIVPDVFADQQAYRAMLLGLYRDLAPHDPDGVLQHEWVNARGVIVRFDRMAMEIRLTDVQECPAMDFAITELVVATLRALTAERWGSLSQLEATGTRELSRLLDAAATHGEQAGTDNTALLRLFGCNSRSASGAQLWRHLAEYADASGLLSRAAAQALETYLGHGTLARRILRTLRTDPDRGRIRAVYRNLADCLAGNQPYVG